MATHSRGAPYPVSTDANDTPAWLNSLASWVNERPGVTPATTTQRNAMSGVERWDGRVVVDTTLDRLFRWDAGTATWIQLPDSGDIAALLATTGLPSQDAITASRGVSASAARADHIHPAAAWQSWSPQLQSPSTMGNATVVGRWVAIGKTIHFWGRITIGTTTALSGVLIINLPVACNIAAGPASVAALDAMFVDATISTYQGYAAMNGAGGTVSVYGSTANGVFSGTYPFAMNVGDEIYIRGTYESV